MALYTKKSNGIMVLQDYLRIKNFILHQKKHNIHSVDDTNQSEPVDETHPLILDYRPYPGPVAYDEQNG